MKTAPRDPSHAKKQQCTVRSLYLSGAVGVAGYLTGACYLAYGADWVAFSSWVIAIPCFKWAYLRYFPRISEWKGYGRILDVLPARVDPARVAVTLYSVLGCPFCPIVEQRLEALRQEMGFTLTKIDLTLKPHAAASKAIRSVPVVEVGQDRLIGNSTTAQLAHLIDPVSATASLRAS
ncbi:MAG: glutaredoxin family protein [Steroidobacteraceae bacterium]